MDLPPSVDFRALAQRYDHSNMAKVIDGVPAQIERAARLPILQLSASGFDRAVIVGVGGSALPAEVILDAFGSRIAKPVTVHRAYQLPKWVDERVLVIYSSFSGETEETLSSVDQLSANALNVVVVTAGGRLARLAEDKHYPLIRLPVQEEPSGFQPRSATGYFVTFFARLLYMIEALPDPLPELAAVPGLLRSVEFRRQAEQVAAWLGGSVPIVYTDEQHLMSVARIAKIKFNENSKRLAFFNALPEANHNEMIGFTHCPCECSVIYFHDPESHPRIRHRFLTMKKVFEQEQIQHVRFMEWQIPGTTAIQKVFAALTFADWCSYSLALLDGIDPTPVPLVELFKKALKIEET